MANPEPVQPVDPAKKLALLTVEQLALLQAIKDAVAGNAIVEQQVAEYGKTHQE